MLKVIFQIFDHDNINNENRSKKSNNKNTTLKKIKDGMISSMDSFYELIIFIKKKILS